ncbi:MULTISPECIES: YidC/Oxa1 family membrane protein insertase [Leuconostoc]|jgi:YidC/Oxa1 family membrane protein insertase|uniref:YidC/Oxa1 family membrane protein insertase n=1 Tax=Leuconostoc TaxID=1243 RepID=UPI0006613B45|nr:MULTISPECIES: YidC/Oxa1 family membrane protein insertase [Leuconostoc]KAF0260599.1 protein translocase component YidC [Leuconostoc citreum]MBA5937763.1 membrane protein insertase YidC [Leuconostoc citreum]MBE4726141.1 membrane protein insertase YidC [Leuconostoc citreum]MCT3069863.1 membrane protein insertase YidC [Leuconostoc citreum]QEA36166.1 membrane protein insertase YidC [Leuconostoc citreum]
MKRFENILKRIGPLPIILAIIALAIIIVASLTFKGHVASNSFWSAIVAAFTSSILGTSAWFGNNYGLGIIVFTILIRFLILPLMVYQIQSMMKMQVVQPALKALQAKYPGKDTESRQLMVAEQQALYKKEGVNPFASMLPLIVQMPVLFALYQSIYNSPVLKSGKFLWLQLGSHDPYYVLPVLAAVFTFASSWLSMQSTPEQNGMTKAMPYIFPVVIFFSAMAVPSALSLYWVVGNLFQTIQTFFLQNPFKIRRERELAAQKERDMKRKIKKAKRSAKR